MWVLPWRLNIFESHLIATTPDGPPPPAVRAFAEQYGAKWPKAVAKVVEDEAELVAFYDFPAEHWVHLRRRTRSSRRSRPSATGPR